MRIGSRGVVEEIDVDRVGTVAATYFRDDDGWVAEFTVHVAGVDDLAVVHRLHAPSLAEARRAVPSAAAFLAGLPIEPPAPLL